MNIMLGFVCCAFTINGMANSNTSSANLFINSEFCSIAKIRDRFSNKYTPKLILCLIP